MFNHKVVVGAVVATASGLVFATCADIRQTCSQAFELDRAACMKNYSGQQQADCRTRAAQQFEYCVKATGCKF